MWQKISSSPLKMLSLGGFVQILVLIFYVYLVSIQVVNTENFLLHYQSLITLLIFLSIIPFFTYAVLMHYYPVWLKSSDGLEYLQYAVYFFVGNLNFLVILLANSWSKTFLLSLFIFQIILISYSFKALWWLSVWASKKDKNLVLLVHSTLAAYSLFCLFILTYYFIL